MIWLIVVILFLYFVWQQVSKPSASLFGEVIWRGPDSEKKITLTFDDGPNPLATPLILKILKEENIKATFFVIGSNAKKYPDLLKEMVKDGHEIEVHSWHHYPLFFLSSPRRQFRELLETKEVIKRIVGETPQLFRPPWGNRTPWLLAQAKKLQLKTVTWSVDPWDAWLLPTEDRIIRRFTQRLHNGAIILLHDGAGRRLEPRTATVMALARIIEIAKQKNFRFATLRELIGIVSEV